MSTETGRVPDPHVTGSLRDLETVFRHTQPECSERWMWIDYVFINYILGCRVGRVVCLVNG